MAVFTTALAIAAAAKGASSFLGSQSTSRDMQEAGRNSLLTARYNINQRKLESRQTQFGILEQGHQAASNIQRSVDQAVGTATAAAGGSGAIVESGTPRAVLTNIAQEGLHAQMGAILNTKNAMKANRRQTEAHNKTEWKQANAYAKGMERDAKRTMDNARMNLAADTIKAVATYYTPTVGGTTDKVIKGVNVAASTSSATAQSRGGSRYQNPRAKIINPGRKYNPNLRQGSRHHTSVTPGSRTASTRRGGPGSMGGPLGSGKMAVKGWRWNKYTTQGLITQQGQGYSWRKKAGRY